MPIDLPLLGAENACFNSYCGWYVLRLSIFERKRFLSRFTCDHMKHSPETLVSAVRDLLTDNGAKRQEGKEKRPQHACVWHWFMRSRPREKDRREYVPVADSAAPGTLFSIIKLIFTMPAS